MPPTCARSPAGRASTRSSSSATRRCPRIWRKRSCRRPPRRRKRLKPEQAVATLAEVASTRDIRTNQVDISCDVCGRTLLRGERAEAYLAGGERRQVCELCTVRAQQEGWIREAGGDELTLRTSRQEGRGRGFIDKLRARRERAREMAQEAAAAEEEAAFEAAPPV